MNEENHNVDAEVATLTAEVRNLCAGVEKMTDELRRTNDTVQTLHRDQSLTAERVEQLRREVWTPDSASRIRNIELQIRGLYAVVGFVALAIGGKLVSEFMAWLPTVGK